MPYVLLVGPDGTGKSTVADLLIAETDATHRYWRPGFLPALREMRGAGPAPVNTAPHARTPDPVLKATFRTVYYWLDFLLGYLFVVRPQSRRGDVFLLERGWDDVVVDPRRYGLRGPGLARFLAHLLPRPDLAFLLSADADVVHARKAELSREEIDRQLTLWPKVSRAKETVVVDGTMLPTDVAVTIAKRIQSR